MKKYVAIAVLTAVAVAVLAAVFVFDVGSSALGPAATTEEGFFFSGSTRLSYALDIPVDGLPPYPMVVFGHDSGPNTKNEEKDWARRLVENRVAVFRATSWQRWISFLRMPESTRLESG